MMRQELMKVRTKLKKREIVEERHTEWGLLWKNEMLSLR